MLVLQLIYLFMKFYCVDVKSKVFLEVCPQLHFPFTSCKESHSFPVIDRISHRAKFGPFSSEVGLQPSAVEEPCSWDETLADVEASR